MKNLIKSFKELPEEDICAITLGSFMLISLTIGLRILLKNDSLLKLEYLVITKLSILLPMISVTFISLFIKLLIGFLVKKVFVHGIYGNEKNTFSIGNSILNFIIYLFFSIINLF